MYVGAGWNDHIGSKHGDKRRHTLALTQDRPSAATFRVASDAWQYEGACLPPAGASESDRAALIEAFDEPTASDERLAMVRGVCRSCPVVAECGELGTEMRYGFFGGLTPEERRARARGDRRPHEVLAAEAEARRARPTGSHGGVRRGAGWSATVVGAVADERVADRRVVEVVPADLAAPRVAALARPRAVSTSRVAAVGRSSRQRGGPRVLVLGDGAARWHAVAARFGALGGEQAARAVCCSAALPRRTLAMTA